MPELRPGVAYDYQRHYAGLRYEVPTGTGEFINADGARSYDCALIETKYVGSRNSPYILGSPVRSLPFVNDLEDPQSVDYQQNDEFRRYSLALRAPEEVNPFVKLDIVINDADAQPYFQNWVTQNRVPNANFRVGIWPLTK